MVSEFSSEPSVDQFPYDNAPPDPRCGEFISWTLGTTRIVPESKHQPRESEGGED
jgi:hypothetical protein